MKKLSLTLFMVLFVVGITMAQRTISGSISDENGDPLIGATIVEKGTTNGTTTDFDGAYSLSVLDAASTLVVSYIGYNDTEVAMGTSNNLDIQMNSSAELLDEIVVTAVGLERNKAKLGYAIQNVDPDDVVAAKEVNLVDALNAKVAGVNVTSSSGSPGASSNIRIRGNSSINGSNAPLFVVDGVPIDNSSSGNGVDGVDQSNRAIDINPNDIASLTVLKGPSATALYGVRAANGAIIVTTKRGAEGKPRVTVSASYSADRVNKLPARQSTYAQGRTTAGVPTFLGPETSNGFSWGPLISDLEYDGVPTEFDKNGTLVPAGTGNGQAAQAYDPYDFFVTGQTVDLNASVAGGTDKVKYYISGGNLSSKGVVPNSEFSRTTFRVNADAQINDKLTVGMSANYINSGGNRIQRGSNLNGVMLGLLRTSPTFDNGNGLIGQAAADEVSTYVQSNGDQRSYRNGIYDNPYWTVNRNPFVDDVNRIIGNLSASYTFTDWLSLSYKVGVDQYSEKRNSAFDIQTNPFRPVAGSVGQSVATNRDLNSDLVLALNRPINDMIGVNAAIGFNAFDTNYGAQGSIGNTLSIPGFYHISNATDVTSEEIISRKRIFGVFGTADISYDDFLFLNLTARNDWSSTLPENGNTFQSYSAALGIAITEALDIQNDVLSYAKLRFSYGAVGNDALRYATRSVFEPAGFQNGNEASADGFVTGITFPAFGVNSFERDELLANALITPETTTTYEIGAELKLFRSKLDLDVNYFNATSSDLIIATDISAATGYTNAVENAATIKNYGWEITAGITPISRNDFSWDIDVNFTQMENDVIELAEGIESIGLAGFVSTSADVVAGNPFSAIFGTGWQRNDNGDVIIGASGWPLVDGTGNKVLGDPNPDWTAGIRNSFSFAGVSVSALIDIRQGGDMWCGTCGIIDYFGTSQQSADERNDIVVFDGVQNTGTADEPVYVDNNTSVALASADPSASFSSYYRQRFGFGGITEMNIYDTSWIRLRELTVAYELPANILGDDLGATISLSGRNLWLSTDYPGIDPETNLSGDSNGIGLDYFNMPNTKSYTATVKLNF